MYFLHQVLSPPFPPSFLRYVETKTLNVKRYYVIMLLCHEEPFSVFPVACAPRFSLLYDIASTLLIILYSPYSTLPYFILLYCAPFPALFVEMVDAQCGLCLWVGRETARW